MLPFLLVALVVHLRPVTEHRFMYDVQPAPTWGGRATYLAIVTAAQMLTILCAGFDLSVGSSVALTSVVTSMTMVSFEPGPTAMIVAVVAGIGVATLVGAVNGAIISLWRVSPFVVTLGMMSAAHGAALLLSDGVPIFNLPEAFNAVLGAGQVAGVPAPIILCAVIIAVMFIVLNWTRVGRYFYALGGNTEAARLSGIPVKNYTFLAYLLCGTLTGIAGVMLTARVASGEPNLGAAMPLESIAAAVIGGVSLRGGEGSILGAVCGAVFIVLIRNGMDMVNISSYLQMVVMGVLLIFAVVMDQYRLKLKGR